MKSKAGAAKASAEAISWNKKWFTEDEAAGYLGLSPQTLRKWRAKGCTSKGESVPQCFKRGVSYYYQIEDLDKWIMGGKQYGNVA